MTEEAAAQTGWRSWFASTGAPPAWGLVRYAAAGLIVGAGLSSPLPDFRGTMLGALAGLLVAAAGSAGPSGISRRLALLTAGLGSSSRPSRSEPAPIPSGPRSRWRRSRC